MDDPLKILSSGGSDRMMTGLARAAKAAGVRAVARVLASRSKERSAATRHLVRSLGLAGALASLPMGLALTRRGLPILSSKAELPATRSSPASRERQGDRQSVVPAAVMEAQIKFSVKPGEARDLGDPVIRIVDQAG